MGILNCNINIEGYWRDRNKQNIPKYAGIFFVYEANFDTKNDVIRLIRLIYIGQSHSIQEHINKAVLENVWSEFVSGSNELCFSCAFLATESERVTAAFVYHFKPPANKEYIDSFTYDTTTIMPSGKTLLLNGAFTVQKSIA